MRFLDKFKFLILKLETKNKSLNDLFRVEPDTTPFTFNIAAPKNVCADNCKDDITQQKLVPHAVCLLVQDF